MPEPLDTQTPRCPRCAYDLTGQTAATRATSADFVSSPASNATGLPSPPVGEGGRAQRDRERGLGVQAPPPFSAWTHACPLTATCPECGFTFEWADLLKPSRLRMPWLYEHATHWWDVRRAWGTCVRALAPSRFWQRVTIYNRVSLGRLVLIHPLCVACILALSSIGAAVVAAGAILLAPLLRVRLTQLDVGDAVGAFTMQFGSLLGARERQLAWVWEPERYEAPFWLFGVGAPFVLAAAAKTFAFTPGASDARIRLAHLTRGATYALVWPLSIFALHSLLYFLTICSMAARLTFNWHWINSRLAPWMTDYPDRMDPGVEAIVLLVGQSVGWANFVSWYIKPKRPGLIACASVLTGWLVSAGCVVAYAALR